MVTNPDHDAAYPYKNPSKSLFSLGTFPDWIIAGCTVVIAVVGFFQLCVYRQQKRIMEQQKAIMEREGKRQVEINRLLYGVPDVTPTPWMGVYDQNGQIRAVINVYNRGTAPANIIQIAAKVQFSDSAPRDCISDNFVDAEPPLLPKFEKGLTPFDPNHESPKAADHATATFYLDKAIPVAQSGPYSRKNIYICGSIKFHESITDEPAPRPTTFCRVVPAKILFRDTNAALPDECDKEQTSQP